MVDRHALARDVAHLIEALPEGRELPSIGLNAAEQADDRHRTLLRPRRERPRSCGAAERGQELSSSDVACHATLRLGVIHAMAR
jgi:hypothetical protein